MTLSRRRILHLGAGGVSLCATGAAAAQTYPARPVRIIVGFAAGGGNDLIARLIAQWLSENLRQSFIVENRPGGGSNIATGVVAHAAPDGYTLLLVGPQNTINATLYDDLDFKFPEDFAPIAGITRDTNVMVVNPSFPARTVAAFIDHAKANPGKINMGSAGIGSAGHVAGELFEMMTGVKLVHVPYRGLAPALTDVVGGRTDVCFANLAGAVELIKAGKLRALAVTTATRTASLPDAPTIAETVPGYEASSLFGLAAPKDTPADVVDVLNRGVNAALADQTIKARLSGAGATVLPGSAADFSRLLADEKAKWSKVIKFAGIKPE